MKKRPISLFAMKGTAAEEKKGTHTGSSQPHSELRRQLYSPHPHEFEALDAEDSLLLSSYRNGHLTK
jgi:hypothetical protein